MSNQISEPKLYAGIEAGGTKFNCVVGSDPLNVIARHKIPTTTPEETLGKSRDFFQEQIEAHGPISGLGIACFGPVDLQQSSSSYGYITATPKKHWSHTDVVGFFKDAFDVPIGFDTDTNGAALGEYLHGAAQGVGDFVYFTIGTGIGAGVFANGQLVKGLVHTEVGHMLVPRATDDLNSYEGFCPFHTNCLTDLACGPAIEKRWQRPGYELGEDHEAWELQAHYLAVMCFNTAMCFSPRLIILGGGVMDQSHLFPKVHRKFERLLNGYMMPDIPLDEYIVPIGLPGLSGEVGALELAVRAAEGGSNFTSLV